MHAYVVGFRGRGTDARDWDRAVLVANDAVEIYYFVGFRAAAVYLTPGAATRLQNHPGVAWMHADTAGPVAYGTGEVASWTYAVHGFNQTYSYRLGQPAVHVAVIGNGVQCSLADLDSLCQTGVEITGPPNVDGGSSHETFIASIIGAKVGNGIGVKGGAPRVGLYSIRAAELIAGIPSLSCTNHAMAIEIAVDPDGPVNADVISDSYGYFGTTSISCPQVDSALDYAHATNTVVVASAGNGGYNDVWWPAEHQYTIAVSSVKQSPLRLSTGSNYGPEIDIAAGGENVKGLDRYGSVVTESGTSWAVPQVVAAIALLIDDKLEVEGCKPRIPEIEAALFDNTQAPADPFVEDWYGSGVLDAWAAFSSDWMTVPCFEWP